MSKEIFNENLPSRVCLFFDHSIGDLDFRDYVFEYSVNLAGARFVGNVNFSGAVFKHDANFNKTVFKGDALFRNCHFERGAHFGLSSFFKDTDFFRSNFVGILYLWNSSFHKNAYFEQIIVSLTNGLPAGCDGQANFSWTRFSEKAIFTYAKFYWPVHFWRTQFKADVMLDQCEFHEKVTFQGKQNDVLFPRFDLIKPEVVRALELKGLFESDTEYDTIFNNERISSFVMFKNVHSLQDLENKLDSFSDVEIAPPEREIIRSEWNKGAQKMFSDNISVSFRGTTFKKLQETEFTHVDFDRVTFDGSIYGSVEEKKAFREIIRGRLYDVFISHASEDKEDLVRPLADKLKEMGLSVWYDESQIEIGDSLKKSIDKGLQKSRFGVVVLSPDFFAKAKTWPPYEFKKLVAKEKKTGKITFFLWHKVKKNEVEEYSKSLTDRRALDTAMCGLDEIAEKIVNAIKR